MYYLLKSIIIIVVLLLCIPDLKGEEYFLSNITYEELRGFISLETDENDETIEFLNIKDPITGNSEIIPTANINAGIVIFRIKNRNVIKLKGVNFDLKFGGKVVLEYLSNGITRKWKKDILNITSSYTLTKDSLIVKDMEFKVKKVLGNEIGIKRIIYK